LGKSKSPGILNENYFKQLELFKKLKKKKIIFELVRKSQSEDGLSVMLETQMKMNTQKSNKKLFNSSLLKSLVA
jgi:hypothetical protein